jgi:ParB family chromosome partitioning protein
MASLRERMAQKTAEIRGTADIPLAEALAEVPDKPKTGTGLTAALASKDAALAAKDERIRELEAKGVASEIPVTAIAPNPWQPRRLFNEAKLTELAESIRETGLVQPIVVRKCATGYQIVAGERRWRAHKMIGRESIKALIVELTDEDMAMMALVENVVRDDLSDYEVARSIRDTEQQFPNRTRMAAAIGVSRTGLYRYLSFSDLPDFVIRDLDVNPSLLSAKSAEQLTSALKEPTGAALDIARVLWAEVVSGNLDQTKLAASVKSALARGASPASVRERSIEKIFAGKDQAGSITKDTSGFTVKLKTGVLTQEKEERLRALIAELLNEN